MRAEPIGQYPQPTCNEHQQAPMQALKVTAHLASGFIAADPWSPSLDGILAYWHMREQLGDEFATTSAQPHVMEPVTGLPLRVESHGALWWYACSSPIYETAAKVRRYLHRRFDDAQERYLDIQGKSGKVLVAAGPYKNARNAYMQTVTGRIEWHVIGERVEIERLLRRCWHIGARTGSGFGRVRRWEFGEGDEHLALTHRPIPEEAAKSVGPRMVWGIRPPGRLPINRTMCVMP